MTSPAGSETRCRSCGKKIVFGKLGNGKFIPLDLVAPVYALFADGLANRATESLVGVTEDMAAEGAAVPLSARVVGYHVSHFATCPQASQHSRKKSDKG